VEQKTNKKALIGIFAFGLGTMANNLTMGIIAYIMQTYSGVSPTTVALILTIPSLTGMVFAFAFGTLNQKIPCKTLAIFCQIATFIWGMICLFIGGKVSVYVMLVASGLAGFTMGAMNSILGVLLLDTVPNPDRRKTLLGITMSVANLGGVFFATVGGAMAVSRWQNAYILFFLLPVFIVVEMLFLPKRAPEGRVAPAASGSAPKIAGKLPAIVWVLSLHYLLFFLFMYVYGLNISEYIINTYKLGTSVQSGIASSMVTIGGILSGTVFGMYSKWLKKYTITVLMALTVIGLFLPLKFTTSLVGVIGAGFLLGFAMSGAGPYVISYLSELVPHELYPKALSVYSGFMNAGMCTAVYVIAFMTKLACGDGTSIPGKFLVGTVGAAFCFITSIPIYLRKSKARVEEKSETSAL